MGRSGGQRRAQAMSSSTPLFAGQHQTAIQPSFHKIYTTPVALVILLLQVLLQLLVFFGFGDRLPNGFPPRPRQMTAHSAARLDVTAHAVVFAVNIALNRLLAFQHKQHRAKGFLVFYRKTEQLREYPAVLYAIVAALLSVMYVQASSLLMIEILVSVETLLVLAVMVVYISAVTNHNASETVPDTDQQMGASFVPPVPGTMRESSRPEDLDLIRFLRDRNESLSQHIMKLESRPGSATPQSMLDDSEAEHLLEAKEKELRATQIDRDEYKRQVESLERQLRAHAEGESKRSERIGGLEDSLNKCKEENTELRVMLEVERDTNAKAQRIISLIQSGSPGARP